jgi:hypothetical protein
MSPHIKSTATGPGGLRGAWGRVIGAHDDSILGFAMQLSLTNMSLSQQSVTKNKNQNK